MPTMGANIECGFKLAMENHLFAARTLVPKIVWDVFFFDECPDLGANIV
jgi:hypothetical protein